MNKLNILALKSSKFNIEKNGHSRNRNTLVETYTEDQNVQKEVKLKSLKANFLSFNKIPTRQQNSA